jgi:hypothetical protein
MLLTIFLLVLMRGGLSSSCAPRSLPEPVGVDAVDFVSTGRAVVVTAGR